MNEKKNLIDVDGASTHSIRVSARGRDRGPQSGTYLECCTAACMTWELAESGKHFITTIINGSDLVPTFSTDYMLPTPISQNPPSMPNVLASMNKEGNTRASKITGVSKGGFLHHDVHENLHTDPKKDPRDSATTSHQTTQKNQYNQLIHLGKVSGQGHNK
ncbi:hypothetical protein H5410_004061 [Solanum commersonii]|uniref:Uncharacterized protein n=1 Tax=Solanum commersonii TaxID=4109 RepID=A0A9J6B6P8_SOLCO|nr:hypothetical protein H5410_004061 [Solanum commersonii]